ncbi:hypothetical protein J8N05_25980 [Streptomyces sp. BH-SS-21]|uniref:Uncharacterized protein n=1 Tax=Streptomyces liliiviolaceus TaxID=2823109 RepID=A0A941B8I4_9ACTN|nr:hypothetical protein [Streptomyces liliiviolaceus]MBQ0851621.1 hypothetical protein [Streptomyces liliiviolaceus]
MIDLVLYGPSGPQPLGLPAPVRVELRNTGGHHLWIAGVLDGSENGLRFPRYRPTITRAGEGEGEGEGDVGGGGEDAGSAGSGAVVASPAPAEDPLVGPLRPADLRTLAPGESWDPTSGPGCLPLMTFAHFAPRRPGRYRYTLTLDTDAARLEDWLGGFGVPVGSAREDLLALVARVPRTSVVADPVEVDFR